jgi:hypothetical protein
MHRPVKVTHSSFIEGSHTTKNTASGLAESTQITIMIILKLLMNYLKNILLLSLL